MIIRVTEAFHFKGEPVTHFPGETLEVDEALCDRAVAIGVAAVVEGEVEEEPVDEDEAPTEAPAEKPKKVGGKKTSKKKE